MSTIENATKYNARSCRYLLGIVLALSCCTASGDTRTWQKMPIAIDLVVGVEQMITLPGDGAVGLPAALADRDTFRTLVTGSTAYWTALDSFDGQRVKVRLTSGEYLLFDVSARREKSPPAAMERIRVVMERAPPSIGPGDLEGGGQPPPSVFELIRYAAQDLYAPTRLVAPLAGIRAIPVGLTGNMTHLYDQGNHPGLVLQPYKAWTVEGLYVTTFIVTNEHRHGVTLDNRLVRHARYAQRSGVAPHFVASAFFQTGLAPRGTDGSRTALFIVTDQPIRAVVRET